MSTPPTPIHPAPNEEVRDLPSEKIPDSTLADIDLNPDLYSEEEEDNDNIEIDQQEVEDENIAIDSHTQQQQPDFQTHEQKNGYPIHLNNSRLNRLRQPDLVEESESEMEDVDLYKFQQITLPFEEAFQLFQIDFNSIEYSPISQQQQSKLINYIDEHLLQIQRNFIKSQVENIQTYSFIQLIKDLSELISIIWISISKKNTLFGQMDYYIKILGDLEDQLNHYQHIFNANFSIDSIRIDLNKLVTFFKFFQKIDLQLSLIIDGYETNTNTITKASNTELIRLYPIISRLRILIISRIEDLRIKLNKVRNETTNKQIISDSQNLLNLFEVEISRLFEGVLDRASL
ncbi:uncharacterized protein J8A68_000766 [[Candida] subhashii]|uniref:Uncharacterized protein n=1 Tax=[Candida] subhashii TaxID=561895 RepID=A0A8J5URQ2_9ASCO|nr:uncharacterized protein J8A68_000766 [[Candida] subhashii]KAG7665746.1 hypothetical protein J8A68_000766 [[Candida] subhashii]